MRAGTPTRSLLAGVLLVCCAAPALAATPPNARALADRARSIREVEDLGGYGRALEAMKALQRELPSPDADLEIAIALNEARVGQLDSAATRLRSPLLTAALADSLPVERRLHYFWGRDEAWTNGRFDGWYWYVARARAEVAAAAGRWDEALAAARLAVAAHGYAGKEWWVLALCAAHANQHAEAQHAALRASTLDPTLPEPLYLLGLYAWREGKRSMAERAFREALRRDSTWQAPAVALVRSKLPASRPDAFPTEFFAGERSLSLLTSRDWPKSEHFVQMEQPAMILRQAPADVPPDVAFERDPPPLLLAICLDERGRPVTHELPWVAPGSVPDAWISAVVGSIPQWEFRPAMVRGEPHKVWVSVQYSVPPR